jgi:pimeloyl-ACP methyl ester carboxylesterase
MLVERYFNTDKLTINYAQAVGAQETQPAGSPLVLLHGGSGRWQNLEEVIIELAARHSVYAPDLRGHGKSGWAPGAYEVEDYSEDGAAFLQNVLREPAVLFGHSLGGQVAIMVAARYPHLVSALIIGDAPFDREKLRARLAHGRERLVTWRDLAGTARSMEEVLEAIKDTPLEVPGKPQPVPARVLYGEDHPGHLWMAANLRGNDPEMLDAVIEFDEMHAAYDYEYLFPQITCPVLIIQANPALGGAISDEEVERALTLLPDATVARLETVGHELFWPEKAPALRAIEHFLDSLPAAASVAW